MADSGKVDCRKASWLMSVARERELSAEESEALRLHLGRCLKCRNFEEQLRFLHEAARRFGK
ncbi:MAG TPA: hypothetical protein VFV55_08485 [Usitatibacteraceae bacterium]|nr:hypothetical protein [Usitatibacteraceae bacterium]